MKDVNPFLLFDEWHDEAKLAKIPEDTAAMLSTCVDNIPTSRVVLMKQMNNEGFIFCTNSNSRKSIELRANHNASICFYWENIGKQIRINGIAHEISKDQSISFFQKRDRKHQLGSLSSKQSQILDQRQTLINKYNANEEAYIGRQVACPEFWTGFKIVPHYFEFWQRDVSRLHHRKCFKLLNNLWKSDLLYP